MCMGPDDGCQDVPEPIAPIDMTLVSLEPTRMPMSLPFITSSGPMFMFIPPMSVPGIRPIGLADGLAEGIGIFIFISGEADGPGEAGICIPGIFICACGDDDGDACGSCMPGIFI
jgi:hypothetical protein